MGYAEFNPNVKKVNLKPKGEVEIVLTTYLSDLRGSVETLSDMIDQKVRVALESTVVTYNVEINALTERQIKTYRVDENGVVSEVKPEGEQMELNLGIPKKEDPIKEVPQEIDRKIVDDFILAMLAPDYPDLPYPFYAWVLELNDGSTYMRIASDYGMSSGKVSELLDEYRSRVAPLAAKWDEWRQNKDETESPKMETPGEEQKGDSTVSEPEGDAPEGDGDSDPDQAGSGLDEEVPDWMTDGHGGGEMDFTDDGSGHESGNPEEELNDYEREIMGEGEISKEALEEFIINQAPTFEDIPFDFPALLKQRKEGSKTWMQIAKEVGVPSSQISSKYSAYKKRVEKLMRDGGAA